ncbi:MAG: nucleotidyltransferase domain-containing protein [Spirochaetales bacterium]|nr:nucleotidyltransferase domain-containing protein [Spirochaetales bacterium]
MYKIDDSIRIKVDSFCNEIKSEFNIDEIYLYGSYANGNFDEWSDIDLAVILNEESAHSKEIYLKGKSFDLRFDAFGFTKNDFENSLLPIMPEIKRTGVKLI